MLPASYVTPAAVILVAGGVLSCFAGYRLFRVVLGLYGFFLGAVVTTSIMGSASSMFAQVLAGVVGGLVGAVLMIAAYFLGVGLVGAGLAALALDTGWRAVQHTDPPTVVLVVVAVLGALGALSIVRFVVIFGTAISGAWTTILGGLALAGDRAATHATSPTDVWVLYPVDPMPSKWWVYAAWFALALIGVIVQLSTTTKLAGPKKPKKTPKKNGD